VGVRVGVALSSFKTVGATVLGGKPVGATVLGGFVGVTVLGGLWALYLPSQTCAAQGTLTK